MKTHGRKYLAIAGAIALAAQPALAAAQSGDVKSYDEKLIRLAEVLGAVHYLRELCGANEGQYWRDQMEELLAAEGSTALRKARLTRGFNQGYRSYSRTYSSCTGSAQTAVARFLAEGVELTDGLIKASP